jgi:hypothetical protein
MNLVDNQNLLQTTRRVLLERAGGITCSLSWILQAAIVRTTEAGQRFHVSFKCLRRRHASNAASGGCHSVAKLVMSDKQMAMSPTTFSKFVMLRHSKLAIAEQVNERYLSFTCSALKEMYKDEAQHVAHDITARLCALPLEPEVAADSESLDDEPLFPPRDPDEEPH